MVQYLQFRILEFPLTLANFHIDPENSQFLLETNLPTPIWQGHAGSMLIELRVKT
jgi:hypothetical protein